MSDSNKPTVLFLCSANAARSQMAEALLRHYASDRFEACSAGLNPTQVHPLTLRVLAERGIDTNRLYAKPVSEFLGRVTVRHAIIVCEKAQQNCPRVFPFFATKDHYWPFDDPADSQGTESQMLARFRAVRDQIDERITKWLEVEGQP